MNRFLDCDIYCNQLKTTIESYFDTIKLFNNKKILITGSTGLICSTIVDLLEYANLFYDLNIYIYAAVRNINKAKKRFKDYKNICILEYDANKPVMFNESFDFIIHGSSNASPEKYVSEPVETFNANVFGLKNLIDYGIKNNVNRILYISSSEVYGIRSNPRPFEENDYGYIDFLNPRSSYSVSKRASETLCKSYSHEYDCDIVMVRPGHIYGPTAKLSDKRVSSDFSFKAARKENLVLKSAGNQKRSYCYCVDCAMAILFVLLNGKKGEAYNISNKNSIISIRYLSELIAKFGGVKLSFSKQNENDSKIFNPMINSDLCSEKIESIGWKGLFDAETGLKATIEILRYIY